MEKLIVGNVELEITEWTETNLQEFVGRYDKDNIISAELVVTLSDGSKKSLNVGQILSTRYQAYEPETGIKIEDQVLI